MSQSLVIHRPIRSSKISQKFGANQACVYPNGKVVAKTGATCPSGSQEFYKSVGLRGHNGIDAPAIHGEMVVHGGTFSGWMKIEKDEQGGIGVDVVSYKPLKVGDKTSHVKLRYWHLKTAIGWDGKDVVYGQPIGLADNTGASSGDHLHWAPKWCDEKGRSLNENNGFYGAFDPTPFYTHDIYAADSAAMLNVKPPALSVQERKEINSQLSAVRRMLLDIRDLVYRV